MKRELDALGYPRMDPDLSKMSDFDWEVEEQDQGLLPRDPGKEIDYSKIKFRREYSDPDWIEFD